MNETLKVRALFDGVVEEEINFSTPPTSGEEYIKRVIFEARQCNDVVFAKIDESKLKKPTLNVKPLPECIKAPECFGPTLEWQKRKVSDFSNIRLYISQLRDEIANSKSTIDTSKVKLPYILHRFSWIEVCTGIISKRYPPCTPTLTVILSMNQPLIEQVLRYLIEYLEDEKTIVPYLGRWLYALLAALEVPLKPDVCANLRSLARTCSTMRSQLDPTSANDAASLNLFICLVARYFRQLDLADP